MKNKLLGEIKNAAKAYGYKLNERYDAENLKLVFLGEHHKKNAKDTAGLVNFIAGKNPSKACFLEGLEGFSDVSKIKNKMNEDSYVIHLDSSINLVGVDSSGLIDKSYKLLRHEFRFYDFICPSDYDFVDFISTFCFMPLSNKLLNALGELADERSRYAIERIDKYLKTPEFSEGVYPVVFGSKHLELLSELSREKRIPYIYLQAK